jgi:Pyridoxamine 5'-phosphate oxidase
MDATALALIETERRATLVTIDDQGRPRPTPFCFVASSDGDRLVLHTPIDEKPKGGTAPDDLPRLRDIRARPAVTVLVDHWDEDWTKLAWAVLHGTANLLRVRNGHGRSPPSVSATRSTPAMRSRSGP